MQGKRKFPLATLAQLLMKGFVVIIMGSKAEIKISPFMLGENNPVPRHAPRPGAVAKATQEAFENVEVVQDVVVFPECFSKAAQLQANAKLTLYV